jgi:mannosyl-oligosaccharide alpha-1,2-mannosidase
MTSWIRAALLLPVLLVASLDDFDATSASERRERVGNALDHAYRSWRRQCWGRDEVKPRTGGCTNGLLSGRPGWPRPAEPLPPGHSAEESGLALTLIDSLDTLWLAGRRAEFEEAREWVRRSLSFDVDAYVSVFELTIRGLGGLLAAHWLTHEFGGSTDSVFLDAAHDLGKRLLPAFDHPQRARGVHPLPYPAVNLRTGAGAVPVGDGTYAHGDCASCSADGSGIANASVPISEAGSLALEFGALSILTGDPRFAARADAVAAHINALPSPFSRSGSGASASAARQAAGLVPTHLQWANGFFASPANELTLR